MYILISVEGLVLLTYIGENMLLEILEKFEQAKKYWVPAHADNVDWVVYPDRYILEAARFLKGDHLDRLMTIMEERPRSVYLTATLHAEDLVERYAGTGCGFGSSDMTYELKSFLDDLGFKTSFDNHKLVIVD